MKATKKGRTATFAAAFRHCFLRLLLVLPLPSPFMECAGARVYTLAPACWLEQFLYLLLQGPVILDLGSRWTT